MFWYFFLGSQRFTEPCESANRLPVARGCYCSATWQTCLRRNKTVPLNLLSGKN